MQTTSRSLKERQRQERELLILQVAEDVLLEKGYHDTSMDEIAARVGVAKGTVYLHFASKEALVFAIFARDLDTFTQNIETIIEQQQTNRAKLEAMLHFMYTRLFSKRAALFISIFNSSELRRTFSESGGPLAELRDRLTTLVTALIDAGKQAGEFTTTLPTSIMTGTFFSMVSPYRFLRLTTEEAVEPEELARYIGRIYFNGVGVDSVENKQAE